MHAEQYGQQSHLCLVKILIEQQCQLGSLHMRVLLLLQWEQGLHSGHIPSSLVASAGMQCSQSIVACRLDSLCSLLFFYP